MISYLLIKIKFISQYKNNLNGNLMGTKILTSMDNMGLFYVSFISRV